MKKIGACFWTLNFFGCGRNFEGKIKNGYRIGKKLGEGRKGFSHKCSKNGEIFACKFFFRSKFFVEEIEGLKETENFLKRPEISEIVTKFYEFSGNDKMIVYEFVEGKNLKKVHRTAPFAVKLDLVLQYVSALFVLNSQKILHCGAHWENVLVKKNGKIKLIDLGTISVGKCRKIGKRYYRHPLRGSPFMDAYTVTFFADKVFHCHNNFSRLRTKFKKGKLLPIKRPEISLFALCQAVRFFHIEALLENDENLLGNFHAWLKTLQKRISKN